MALSRKYIDIGVNLTEGMYKGIYHGIKRHDPDYKDVIERAWSMGMQKMIVTGGSLKDSREAINFAKTHENLYCTVGCHPTRCGEFEESGDPEIYLQALKDLALSERGKVVAYGEFGLDYDRMHFCPREQQMKYFEEQLLMSENVKLPLFLHCRNAASDLIDILSRNRDSFNSGVVHSFDGSENDAKSILELNLYIGINGCSLKTADNLEVLSKIPTDYLMIETDAPWCDVRPTHAGAKYIKTTFPSVKKEKWRPGHMIKGRNEPANIVQILEIISHVKEEDIESVCEKVYQNTLKLFFPFKSQ